MFFRIFWGWLLLAQIVLLVVNFAVNPPGIRGLSMTAIINGQQRLANSLLAHFLVLAIATFIGSFLIAYFVTPAMKARIARKGKGPNSRAYHGVVLIGMILQFSLLEATGLFGLAIAFSFGDSAMLVPFSVLSIVGIFLAFPPLLPPPTE